MKYNNYLQYKKISEAIKVSDIKDKIAELKNLCANDKDYRLEFKIIKNSLLIDLISNVDMTKKKYMIDMNTYDGYINTKVMKFSSEDEFFDIIEKEIQLDINISESVVYFSDKFIDILNKVKSPLSKKLLDINNKDITTTSNFIDVVDNTNVSFLPDRKAQEIIKKDGKKEAYKVIRTGAYLVPKESTKYFWDTLGLEYPGEGADVNDVSNNEEVTLLGLLASTNPRSRNVYAAIKRGNGEKLIVNQNSIQLDESLKPLYTTTGRSNIRVGRLSRALLKSNGQEVSDREVEEFVNQFKACVDEYNDVFRGIKLVSGEEIRHNYNDDCYAGGGGTLNSSCMRDEDCQSYFDIYCQNPDKISMACLYNSDSQLIARALVWKLNDGKTFMDRVYSIDDYQVTLLRNYAKSNGWYYKKHNNSTADCEIIDANDNESDGVTLEVSIKKGEYRKYPYVDTIKYYNPELGLLTNIDVNKNYLELEDTDGRTSRGGTEECEDCGGSGEQTCYECDGDGEVDCGNCDGNGEVDCSNCDGSGEVDCPECDGNGDIDGKECEVCKGKCQLDCPECDGNGENKCENCEGSGKESCDSCSGDGTQTCRNCDGDGTVEN